MTVLGKRKAKAQEPSISAEEANEIFRRHFEAQFAPLEPQPNAARRGQTSRNEADDSDSEEEEEDDSEDLCAGGESNSDDDDEEWGGVSEGDDDEQDDDEQDDDDDDTPHVQIIDHSTAQIPSEPRMSKKELRAFMSSKISDHPGLPSSSSTTEEQASGKTTTTTTLPEDAPSLLKQDLELRRLLAESHLLAPTHGSSSPFASSVVHGAAEPKAFAAGRTRQRATDMRIQALGSKTSILKQEKMPMNMRKGMVAAAGAREAKRRREARENGVILERSAAGSGSGGGGGKAKKAAQRSRDRGVDGPGVGRMKGAQLRISERDVRSIEGGKDAFGRRSKSRR